MKCIIIFYWSCFLTICTFGQAKIIETDRAGQTLTAHTTSKNWFQTEIGYQKELTRLSFMKENDRVFQAPLTLVKYGFSNRLEGRVIAYWQVDKYYAINFVKPYKGTTNTQIGFKYNFLKQKGILPKTSVIAHYRINSFNTNPRGYDTTNGGNISLAMLHKINEQLDLTYSFGVDKLSWLYVDTRYLYSISPKFMLADNWQIFIEIFGILRKNRTAQTTIDCGLAYFLNDNLKIDCFAGISISERVKNKFYGFGVSFRLNSVKTN
jgi:Putative MetA-pathway of phenol degradation